MARDLPSLRDGVPRTHRLRIGRPRHNLHAQLTSFIGREAELATIERLHGTTRLLTLTGAGGVGKTRLSLQLAERLLPVYRHGVWQVELAALAEPHLLPEALAAVLGAHEQAGRPLVETLTAWLTQRELLLVLDNCEHLAPACARLVERLLRGCPGLRILATSRQPLGVAGEVCWPVPPLALPAEADGPAVRLLESEAGRVPVLTVGQIAARLEDRFRLLAHPDSTAPSRHRTLGTLVDWSYDLLSEPEQRLLRRLSVFAGGWRLEAAELVCAGDGVAAEEILDLLGRLVARSLVLADEQQGAMRYRLLETIREYGRLKLTEAGEEVATRHQHQHWCMELGEGAALRIFGPELVPACDLLALELDNIRAALAWAREAPPADSIAALERALRLAAALGRFWDIRGRHNEGRAWLDELLARASACADQVVDKLALARGRALIQAGYLAMMRDEPREAETLLLEGASLCRAAGDEFHCALALSDVGVAIFMSGDLERGGGLIEEGLTIGTRIGSPFVAAASKFELGELAAARGDWETASERFEDSLEDTRRNGILLGTPYILSALGRRASMLGDHARAIELQREGLAIRAELRDFRGIALSLADLGPTLMACGDARRAAAVLGSVDALLDLLGVPGILLPLWSTRREQAVTAARAALGESGFEAAYARGRVLPLEEAVRYALGETEPEAPPATAPEDPELARLSPREREVAALVARGLTNRQIAQELVISEATAASHIAHILNKLDFHARAQIATWATERGLAAPLLPN